MSENIVKIKKRVNPYVMVDKAVIEEKRLSFKAKGLIVYLLSRPSDWTIMIEDLIKRSTDGRDSVQSALKELQELGYAVLTTQRGENGLLLGKHWTIIEDPTDKPVFPLSDRQAGFPSDGKSTTTNKEKTLKNDINKRPDGKSLIPTLAEVLQRAKEIDLSESKAESFFYYWESMGWKRGKNPITKWKAALQTWKLKGLEYAKPTPRPERNGNAMTGLPKSKDKWFIDEQKGIYRLISHKPTNATNELNLES
jgi:hypothetical protein